MDGCRFTAPTPARPASASRRSQQLALRGQRPRRQGQRSRHQATRLLAEELCRALGIPTRLLCLLPTWRSIDCWNSRPFAGPPRLRASAVGAARRQSVPTSDAGSPLKLTSSRTRSPERMVRLCSAPPHLRVRQLARLRNPVVDMPPDRRVTHCVAPVDQPRLNLIVEPPEACR